MLFSVDEDITVRLNSIAADPQLLAPIQAACVAVQRTLERGNKIYVYGCGAAGRLAKQMESNFWRPFWTRVKQLDEVCWEWSWSEDDGFVLVLGQDLCEDQGRDGQGGCWRVVTG